MMSSNWMVMKGQGYPFSTYRQAVLAYKHWQVLPLNHPFIQLVRIIVQLWCHTWLWWPLLPLPTCQNYFKRYPNCLFCVRFLIFIFLIDVLDLPKTSCDVICLICSKKCFKKILWQVKPTFFLKIQNLKSFEKDWAWIWQNKIFTIEWTLM